MSTLPPAPGGYPAYPQSQGPEGQDHPPSEAAMSSLNLPPIHSADGRPQPPQQQPPPQPQHQQHTGQPPPPYQYYQAYAPPPSGDGPLRYPLPPNNDARVMSGGRHKKEIKRRTKTGCLTCRKRRIKCDEGHPSCRNCQKSKRECLGYDPIFKGTPGPPQIQPALSAAPSMYSPAANSPYPPPHGYAPVPYGPPPTGSENVKPESYDQSSAIDPALGGAAQGGPAIVGQGSEPGGHRAKRTKIEELLCLRAYSPPPLAPPSTLPSTPHDEMKHICSTVYAPGIDKFLECKWFATRGVDRLMADKQLRDQFAYLIGRYAVDSNTPNHTDYRFVTQSLEATVVWAMMNMCRQVANVPKAENEQLDTEDIKAGILDATKRLEIFEALVAGEYLETESAPKSPEITANGTALEDQLKSRERNFWRHVHTFLTIRDNEAVTAKQIDDTLTLCRGLLDSRENRDVIYSIMIARHVGARMAEFPENLKQPATNDEKDNHAKLAVAKKFIEDESSRGTNQVVQRLCGMAARSWFIRR